MPQLLSLAQAASSELDAAILQTAVTVGLAAYAGSLYRRYRKAHFAWFGLTWLVYAVRLGAIMAFLFTQASAWLYWHQVVTGWTALALLWSALVFSRQLQFRPRYLLVALFPIAWSYVAIYVMRDFLWAALPAVLFLSVVTLWTAAVFFRHYQRTRVAGARFLAGALFLWALHHLDYPFLRARGAWSPWGYYLDIIFLLATATGLTLLVLDELRQGFSALTSLAAVVSDRGQTDDMEALLGRAMTLPATRGAALFSRGDRTDGRDGGVSFVRGVGECAAWEGHTPNDEALSLIAAAIKSGEPKVRGGWPPQGDGMTAFPYAAALPIPRATGATAALVLVGDARNPFAALDDAFLVALGQQIGSALDGAELTRRLRARTDELTRLSSRMIEQHEEERRRLSLELHDETAQVFSAVKLQLGLVRERAAGEVATGLDRAASLVDEGMRSIRNVTETLRPTVLDHLGLVPALRSLATSFEGQCGIPVSLEAPDAFPRLTDDAELALFRALQEALSNVARHAGASHVWVTLGVREGAVHFSVADNGRGASGAAPNGIGNLDLERLERAGHMGLAGMRERITALGGTVSVGRDQRGGLQLTIDVPVRGQVEA
ncbi:MAG: ATP-binding protein [Gemmatimonadaceae bacterium]